MIAYHEYDHSCLDPLAALYGASPAPTPFQVRGAPCWDWVLTGTESGLPVRLRLWLPLRRVDAMQGTSTWVLKDVDRVEIIPGVEAIFRRLEPAAFLFVTVRGRCSLVT